MKDLRREATAWKWLLGLKRIKWERCGFRARDQQIIIRFCPGELGANSGAPLVHLSVEYPEIEDRIETQGNSLYEAVYLLQAKLWERGVKLPFLSSRI